MNPREEHEKKLDELIKKINTLLEDIDSIGEEDFKKIVACFKDKTMAVGRAEFSGKDIEISDKPFD